MKSSWIFLFLTVLITVAGYVIWPIIHPYMGAIQSWLITFKEFCHHNPFLGYLVYGALLALILLLGLPFAVAIMLLAGITYDFWEATMLVSVCRLLVAIAVFLLARQMVRSSLKIKRQPALFQKFEQHPKLGLFLARLSPLPDISVNYAMGNSSLDCIQYSVISLIGMIPLTLLCVWTGHELGSVTQLVKALN